MDENTKQTRKLLASIPNESMSQSDSKNPEEAASWISVLVWQWAQPLISLGAKRPLDQADLPPLRKPDSVYTIETTFREGDTTLKMLLREYGSRYFAAVMAFQSGWLLFVLLQVFVVKELVNFVGSNTQKPTWLGILWSVAMFFSAIGQAMGLHHSMRLSFRYGMQAKAALMARIYAKTLKIRQNALSGSVPDNRDPNELKGWRRNKSRATVTEGTNVLTSDTQRIVDAFTYGSFLLYNPIVVLAVAIALSLALGVSGFIGVLVMVVTVPLQLLSGKFTAQLRSKTIKETDDRVSLEAEVIRGIRVVKYGAWEDFFARKITQIRQREVKWLLVAGLLEALNNAIVFTITPVVALTTFSCYTMLVDEVLDAGTAFLAIALFNVAFRSLSVLPFAIKAISQSVVAFNRMDKYLALPEVQPRQPATSSQPGDVDFRNVSFSWKEGGDSVLENISLRIRPRSKVAIVGKVGSGKSSLAMAFLNELYVVEGEAFVSGTISYAAQVPWILSGTILDNVLVGSSFDRERYDETLRLCCLRDDIALLPAGDKTEIGERGVNLSGGQKARLSLARACYAESDIVILDDPLSAVDVRVGHQLTENLLDGESPLLRGKTTVLITHNLEAISDFDQVLSLSENGIAFNGSYGNFIQSELFVELSHDSPIIEKKRSEDDDEINAESKGTPSSLAQIQELMQTAKVPEKTATTAKAELIQPESRERGNVSRQIYRDYVRASGGLPAVVVLSLLFVGSQGARQWSDFWISEWSTDGGNRIDPLAPLNGNRFYALILLALTAGTFFLVLLRVCSYITCSRLAAKRLHDRLLESILRAKLEYFDTNPVGRILNRFGKDMDQIDDLLPLTSLDFIQVATLALGAVITIAIIVPWMLLLLLPVAVVFVLIQRMYLKSSRELKRLDGISRSPIYTQFEETESGTPTVRALELEKQFLCEFFEKVDKNNEAYYCFISIGRWLAVRLDLLAGVVVCLTSLMVVLLRNRIDPGLAGLAITQSMQATGIFQWGVRQAAEAENLFTSVERVTTAVRGMFLEPDGKNGTVPNNWPLEGAMEWRDVCMRYRENLPLALDGLSFSIKGGEKVGVVGRTGAGKSSLTAALFRAVELSSGSISIDGVNIASLPLNALRKAIAVVPQDPVLFKGTLRENIDPAGESIDNDIWSAVRSVNFTELRELPMGLDTAVADSGRNFSVGERQLLCLARALISQSKIIVLDEATAAVDDQTDRLMQRAIRASFRTCTVITIAHRLHTVADCDRVIVLSNGKLHGSVMTVASE